MCLEADRRVCMLDRAGALMSELFRFSTTTMQWEQLDASRVSGSPQNVGFDCMVAVGSDLYVFGGFTAEGDTRLCDAGRRLGA
jgi:N-acetylneuraminic acid mutarotase